MWGKVRVHDVGDGEGVGGRLYGSVGEYKGRCVWECEGGEPLGVPVGGGEGGRWFSVSGIHTEVRMVVRGAQSVGHCGKAECSR